MTTKRGDSGSAGLLERKCVIIGALKTDTKSDQKYVNTQKMIKNHQKSRNAENEKIIKIRKTEKVTKSRKQKNTKTVKMKNHKMQQKKCQKSTPP